MISSNSKNQGSLKETPGEEIDNLDVENDSTNGLLEYRTPMSDSDHPLSSPFMGKTENPLFLPENGDDPNPNLAKMSDLESTMYTDVSINSYENDVGEGNSSGNVGSVLRSGSWRADYMKITVSNPQKEHEMSSSVVGGNSFMTYLITTETNVVGFGGSEFNVRRRFKDVVGLADRLSECYRGFVIPLRPDKNVVERQVMQKQEFVEQRRAALEKYLRRLAVHPVIKKSEDFKMFLQLEGKLPFGDSARVIIPTEAVKGGRDLLRMFREMKQSVTNDWGSSKLPTREDDKEFLEKTEKLKDIEKQLSNVSDKAESLVKAQQDIGETMGELGLALIKLAKFETEEATCSHQRIRVVDVKRVATAAIKVGRLYRGSNAQTVKHLDTLHDYLGLMLAVQSAFSDRSSALLTLQSVLSELSSLDSKAQKFEAASSKIFGGDKSRIHKISELKETIRVTEDAKTRAVRDYERIKENNRSELERLDKERHEDFLSMLKGFVISQVGYAEKIADVWGKVADETTKFATGAPL
ncbi:hypothetical protein GIB67_038917 [Kingdonia uniflora]|uniref:PX domain-containing protein n=1 Tax=Kingdonia uniflora TaxID=39325 RepID=A0A7J7LQJ6_9MAGN|nr:hypothetical protein GIB67_038917 [Kingdonia uniflora]